MPTGSLTDRSAVGRSLADGADMELAFAEHGGFSRRSATRITQNPFVFFVFSRCLFSFHALPCWSKNEIMGLPWFWLVLDGFGDKKAFPWH